jgi:hypothetical protein
MSDKKKNKKKEESLSANSVETPVGLSWQTGYSLYL